MEIRKAFIRHEPNSHSIQVRYWDRRPNGRVIQAQYDDRDFSLADIERKVRSTAGLQLVCAISGVPI